MASSQSKLTVARIVHHRTGRQREVLDLLARGRTNAQIADSLGVSLDGAKWHVREIMAELDAPTREDAAEYWRAYNGLPSRFSRFAHGLVGLSFLRGAALAGGAIAAVGFAVAVTFVAFGGDEPSRPAGPETTATPGASATAAALLKDSDLTRHGAYRIVPPDYVGPLSKSDAGRTPQPGIKSNDPSVLRGTALYVDVKGLPADFTQTSVDTGDGDSNTVLRQTFAGADSRRRTLEVVRVARNQEPLDVFEPPQDQSGWLTLSTITVGGHEGILLSPSKFSPIPAEAQLVRVQFFAGGVETFLTATGLTPDEVVALATRIAEGGR